MAAEDTQTTTDTTTEMPDAPVTGDELDQPEGDPIEEADRIVPDPDDDDPEETGEEVHGDDDPETGGEPDKDAAGEDATEDPQDDAALGALMDRAIAAGMSDMEILANIENLAAFVDRAEAKPAAAAQPPKPFALPENFDADYGAELGAIFRDGIPGLIREQVDAALAPIRERYQREERARLIAESRSRQEEIDTFFREHGTMFGDRFGTKPVDELDAGDPQFRNRLSAVRIATILGDGYVARGEPRPSWSNLLSMAARAVEDGGPAKPVQRGPNGRFVGRPSGRSAIPKGDDKKASAQERALSILSDAGFDDE